QPSAATLGLLLAAGLGVCLLNPYGIHAFRVPGQLFAPAAAVLRRDPLFQGQFTSPYETLYFTSGIALSAAGLSYFALVVLSLLSFLLNAPGWRWQRALLLAGFFALSALQARANPFFAIVAAPVVAMNLQEFVQRRLARGVQEVATEPEWEGWMLRGRGLTLLVGLGLLAAAWPGWLLPAPYDARQWGAEPDPSPQLAARKIAEWRRQGLLKPGAHGFNLSPEVANYFAWFCPEEEGFLDSRLALYSPQTAEEYVTVRRAILGQQP